jgi:pimeloyl-ACP methyl ester carboxylesterase
LKKRAASESRRRVKTDDGVAIAVTHYDAGSGRLILLAPGFWRVRGDRENVFVAVHLTRLGYDVAAFDFRGHGGSGGRYTFGREEWRDLLAVARAFPAHDGLAVVGFSLGASIAADAIRRAPELPFRALVMVSAPSDFARLRPRPWKPAAWRMMGLRRAFAPPRVDWTAVPRPKPTAEKAVETLGIPKLIVTLEDDWLVRPAHGHRLARAASPPVEHVHLSVRGSLHADAVVRHAPLAFLRELDPFLKTRFPAPDAVKESGTVKP